MCPNRWSLVTSCLWQVTHVSVIVAALSCDFSDFALCAEWHVTQERLRASCMLPVQSACVDRSWQVTQTADASRGEIFVKTRIGPFPSLSECAFPGPWQVSQAWFVALPAGVRGLSALP